MRGRYRTLPTRLPGSPPPNLRDQPPRRIFTLGGRRWAPVQSTMRRERLMAYASPHRATAPPRETHTQPQSASSEVKRAVPAPIPAAPLTTRARHRNHLRMQRVCCLTDRPHNPEP